MYGEIRTPHKFTIIFTKRWYSTNFFSFLFFFLSKDWEKKEESLSFPQQGEFKNIASYKIKYVIYFFSTCKSDNLTRGLNQVLWIIILFLFFETIFSFVIIRLLVCSDFFHWLSFFYLNGQMRRNWEYNLRFKVNIRVTLFNDIFWWKNVREQEEGNYIFFA